MKRILCVILCVCTLCALSVPALAAYEEEEGAPPRWLYADEEEYQRDYAEWKAALEPAASETSTESAGAEDDVSSALPQASNDRYPIGSYVDAAGNVWSADHELLSPGTAPAAPADAVSEVSPAVQDDTGGALVPSQTEALTRIADLVSDIAEDTPTWYVEDLRPTEAPAEVLSGLKALVTSIFGEYTPVMTTTVVTESVGDETHQYLVETVAPGAAGVDYEWLAGVILFGILLFCLMKLLGGVIS